jgi:phosphoribosylformimino-5-aminoimidazole carboxamide ribonucleotide (ProFAR) isomerase
MIIPALDLIDGTVVRLHQGDYASNVITATIRSPFAGLRSPGPKCCTWLI